MISVHMPFIPSPCFIWLPMASEADAYGNENVSYAEKPDITTVCCYTPGTSRPTTSDNIEDGRPHGASVAMTFFLPKTVDADLRGAIIAVAPSDDAALAARRFKVVGEPFSYPRANTPGDYSWCVEGVTYLG